MVGHAKLVLKSDNEPALQALVEQALGRARVQCRGLASISQEHPPAYDSHRNGGVEVGVKLIRGFFRILKLCADARIDKFIPGGPSGGRLAARAHVPDPEREGQMDSLLGPVYEAERSTSAC